MTILEVAALLLIGVGIFTAVVGTVILRRTSLPSDTEIEEVYTVKLDAGAKMKVYQRQTREELRVAYRWLFMSFVLQFLVLTIQAVLFYIQYTRTN